MLFTQLFDFTRRWWCRCHRWRSLERCQYTSEFSETQNSLFVKAFLCAQFALPTISTFPTITHNICQRQLNEITVTSILDCLIDLVILSLTHRVAGEDDVVKWLAAWDWEKDAINVRNKLFIIFSVLHNLMVAVIQHYQNSKSAHVSSPCCLHSTSRMIKQLSQFFICRAVT